MLTNFLRAIIGITYYVVALDTVLLGIALLTMYNFTLTDYTAYQDAISDVKNSGYPVDKLESAIRLLAEDIGLLVFATYSGFLILIVILANRIKYWRDIAQR